MKKKRKAPAPRTCQTCGKSGHPGGMGWHIRWCGKDPADVFASKVDKGPHPKGCWLFTGPISWEGYGHFDTLSSGSGKRKQYQAHRYAWLLQHGSLPPPGKAVCHTCDVRNCVNPAHLFEGTWQDNCDDKVAKRRHLYGEKSTKAKLTDALVLEIRARFRYAGPRKKSNAAELGAEYGVQDQTILAIGRGRTWRHLLDAKEQLPQSHEGEKNA